jgi:hypothetical protein
MYGAGRIILKSELASCCSAYPDLDSLRGRYSHNDRVLTHLSAPVQIRSLRPTISPTPKLTDRYWYRSASWDHC